MLTGKCPKCASEEIYVDATKSRMGRNARDELSVTGLVSVTLTNYVCANCGFTESYILDEQDRERIKRKWQNIHEIEVERVKRQTQLAQIVSISEDDTPEE